MTVPLGDLEGTVPEYDCASGSSWRDCPRYMPIPLGDLECTVPGTWLCHWEILNAPSRVHDYASGRSWMDRHIQSRVPRTSGWLLPRRIRAGGHDGLRDFRQVGGCQWSLARVHWKCPSRHPRELWGFRGRRQGGCPAGGAGWAERGNRELRHAWSNGNEGAITISFCGNPSNRENPPQSGWSFVWLHEEESGGGGGGAIRDGLLPAGSSWGYRPKNKKKQNKSFSEQEIYKKYILCVAIHHMHEYFIMITGV